MENSGDEIKLSEAELEKQCLEILTRLINSGDLQEAVKLCTFILSHNPRHSRFNYELGMIHFRQGNLEAAKECLITAHQYDTTNNAAPLFSVGQVCMSLREYGNAIIAYKKALKVDELRESNKRAYEQKNNTTVLSIGGLEKWMIYLNIGQAFACKARQLKQEKPDELDKAYQCYKNAAIAYNNLCTLLKTKPTHAAMWSEAYLSRMHALLSQAKIDRQLKRTCITLKTLKEMIASAQNLPEMNGAKREIRQLVLKLQYFDGEKLKVDDILNEIYQEELQEVKHWDEKLQFILSWHREEIDWDSVFAQRQRNLRYPKNTKAEKVYESKKRKIRTSDETAQDVSVTKVTRLYQQYTENRMGRAQYPHAFDTMCCSPEFLRLNGPFMFVGSMLSHVISESYIHFDQLVSKYFEHTLSAVECQLQIAGNLVASNNYDVAEIVCVADKLLAKLGTPERLQYFGELVHQSETEEQSQRRVDLKNVTRFRLLQMLFKRDLLKGLVFQLRKELPDALDVFSDCHRWIEQMEIILKMEHRTWQLCELKNQYKNFKVMALVNLVSQHRDKIPRELLARIEKLEALYKTDPMRVQLGRLSVPFPYDLFVSDHKERQRQKAPENANMTDHVLTLCYLTQTGEQKMVPVKFHASGPILALDASAEKYGVTYGDAQKAVVNKINHGIKIIQSIDPENKIEPFRFMSKLEKPTVKYHRGLHEHSEQVFYFELDHIRPHKLINAFVAASGKQLKPGCTVLGLFSDMQSTKTGCPSCKASAIATQHPKPDDEGAFLNRMQAALLQRKFKLRDVEQGKPKLLMATRIIAFSRDRFRREGLIHQNPPTKKRDLEQLENLGIIEELDSSSCVSGYRKQTVFI